MKKSGTKARSTTKSKAKKVPSDIGNEPDLFSMFSTPSTTIEEENKSKHLSEIYNEMLEIRRELHKINI